MGHKLKFVLSDLHIGAGYASNPSYPGNPLEDFRADNELVVFLHRIWQESRQNQRETELIINGDFFEFLQVPAVDGYEPERTYPPEAFVDSSQDASLKRLNIIAQGHPEVFDALSDFIHVEHPQRRITIIKGNHDVNLFWPGVKSRLREILGASGTRASLLLFADEFVSREKIYVEHGHQRAEKINRYRDFFDPRALDDPRQLYYPAGSCFVIDAFNTIEHEHWFIDHLKPITSLIWYTLSWNFELAGQMLVHFIRHTSPDENDNLLQELQDADRRRELARRYTTEPAFRQHFHQRLHPYLNASPSDNNNAATHSLLEVGDNAMALGQADQQQQHTMLRQAAEAVAQREGAWAIMFGHTHYPVQETLSNESVYINTGSWIEDFSDASPETWEALFNHTRSPLNETRLLPYARIDYDEQDMPTARLLYFDPTASQRKETFPGSLWRKFNWLTRILPGGRQ
ncbi:MAG: metallophosphoesterase [Anaerolineae bacterium]|nr:metallophosphoesterase [Anaerolineae bacterium]